MGLPGWHLAASAALPAPNRNQPLAVLEVQGGRLGDPEARLEEEGGHRPVAGGGAGLHGAEEALELVGLQGPGHGRPLPAQEAEEVVGGGQGLVGAGRLEAAAGQEFAAPVLEGVASGRRVPERVPVAGRVAGQEVQEGCAWCKLPISCDGSSRANRQKARWRKGEPVYHEVCSGKSRKAKVSEAWRRWAARPEVKAKRRERAREDRKRRSHLS